MVKRIDQRTDEDTRALARDVRELRPQSFRLGEIRETKKSRSNRLLFFCVRRFPPTLGLSKGVFARGNNHPEYQPGYLVWKPKKSYIPIVQSNGLFCLKSLPKPSAAVLRVSLLRILIASVFDLNGPRTRASTCAVEYRLLIVSNHPIPLELDSDRVR